MYEFESYMNLNLNLYQSNGVGWINLADTKDPSLILVGLI
jgi:hypothetical protein